MLRLYFKIWYKQQTLRGKIRFHWQCFLLVFPINFWARIHLFFDELKCYFIVWKRTKFSKESDYIDIDDLKKELK